jgi:phenylacetate-CoA ligase
LRKNLGLSAGELQAKQETKLRLLVGHAYRKVPYYRTLFDDADMKPGDIQSLHDLPRIPITTREALQFESTERRVDQTLDFAQFIDVETTGSSGQPLTVFITPGEARIRKGVHFRSLLDVGFRWNDHLLQLGFRVSRRTGMHERLGLFRADRIKSSVPPEGQYQRIREINPSFIWSAGFDRRARIGCGNGIKRLWLAHHSIRARRYWQITDRTLQLWFAVPPYGAA